MKHRLGLGILLGAAMLFMVPAVSSAQSAIVGLLTDDSGGVLPGVAVEVTSPSMIEGTKTTVTDTQGRYRFEAMRPGVYKLSFTLTGFGTVVREGVNLPSNFTATVNAEMKVGSLEETINVSGTAPQVDVQQAARTTVIARDVIDSLPISRNVMGLGVLAAGVRPARPIWAACKQPSRWDCGRAVLAASTASSRSKACRCRATRAARRASWTTP
jgi:hypothetical protein